MRTYDRSTQRWAVLGLLASAIAISEVRACDEPPFLTLNDEEAILMRQSRIRAELVSPAMQDLPDGHWAHEWAGEYTIKILDSTHVLRACLSPNAGATMTLEHATGDIFGGLHGEVTGVLDLNQDGEPDGVTIMWIPLEYWSGREEGDKPQNDDSPYYFVRWLGPEHDPAPDAPVGEGRRYLVRESNMISVVNAVNQSRDELELPLHVQSRTNGVPNPVTGVPQLPDEWSELLRWAPLDATVIKVEQIERSHFREARVTLDKGCADGVYEGHRLHVPCLSMNKLGEHTSEYTYFPLDPPFDSDRPEVGDVLRLFMGLTEAPQSKNRTGANQPAEAEVDSAERPSVAVGVSD